MRISRLIKVFFLVFVLVGWAYARPYRFILSSTADGSGNIVVDDDLKVTLLRQDGSSLTIINDSDKQKTSISPVFFYAEKGDRLLIEAVDIGRKGGKKFLSPIYLTNRDTGETQLIVALFPETPSAREREETFLRVEYTIGEPLKEYCISSVPDGCSEIYVDDDVPEVSVNYGDTYKLEAKLSTDKTASLLSMRLMLPADPASSYLIVKDTVFRMKFTNYRGKGYVSRVFLVPVDNQGPVLSVLESPLEIEGNCKENCSETIIYDFNIPIEYLLPPITQSEGIDVQLEQISEGVRQGLQYDIFISPYANPQILFYWKTGQRNFFLSPNGFIQLPYVWNLNGHLKGILWLPRYSPWQQMLLEGKYEFGVAILDNGDISIKSFNFTTNFSDWNYAQQNDTSIETNNIYHIQEVLPQSSSAIEDFVVEAFESSGIQDDGEDKCLRVNSESEDSYLYYCIHLPNEGKFTKGFALMYTAGNYPQAIFSLYLYCRRFERREQNENSTSNLPFSPYTETPQYTFVEVPCSPSSDVLNALVSIRWEDNVSELHLFREKRVSLDSGGDIIILYNYYPLPTYKDSLILHYTFKATLMGQVLIYPDYSSTLTPPIARLIGYRDAPYGVQIKYEVNDWGETEIRLNFKAKIEPINGEKTFNISDYKIKVCLARMENINNDICTYMKMKENNTIEANHIIPTNGESNVNLTYWFEIENPKNGIIGNLLFRKFQMSISIPDLNKVSLSIMGDKYYKLGNPVNIHIRLKAPYKLRNNSANAYLGVYRKGRGIVWISDALSNSGILETSYAKRKLTSFTLSACLDGCSWNIEIPTDNPSSFFAPLFIGKYILIVEIEDKDTGEILGRTLYPFSISLL